MTIKFLALFHHFPRFVLFNLAIFFPQQRINLSELLVYLSLETIHHQVTILIQYAIIDLKLNKKMFEIIMNLLKLFIQSSPQLQITFRYLHS